LRREILATKNTKLPFSPKIKEVDKICPEEGQIGSQNMDPTTQNMISSIITE
jgi:hypothetical protein